MTKKEMELVDKLINESGVQPFMTQSGLIWSYCYQKKEDGEKVLKYIYHKNRKLFNKLDGYGNQNRIEDKLLNHYRDTAWFSDTPRTPDYYMVEFRDTEW